MMDDRTLLLKAAQAAGHTLNARRQSERDAAGHGDVGLWLANGNTCWNPLTESGQALELAVALEMDIGQMVTEGCVTVTALAFDSDVAAHDVPWGTDPLAATRRAIVLVAADLAN
jgi:hypothetical protein